MYFICLQPLKDSTKQIKCVNQKPLKEKKCFIKKNEQEEEAEMNRLL